MSKHKELAKKTAKSGVVAAIIVGVAIALYVGISMYADSVSQQKTEIEGKYSADKNLLESLTSQMNKSGEAEKRFAAIQANRTSANYEASNDVLGDFLRSQKQAFRFDKFTITKVEPSPSDKPELANFNYNISVRPRIKISFQAVSDIHVFSFLDELRAGAPGLLRIDRIELKRTSDMTDATFSQITGGTMPLLVDAKVEFTWIGITPKEKDKKADPASPNQPVN